MAADTTRIAALDHIRGLSVLGILAINAIAFAQPIDVYMDPALSSVPLSRADVISWWLTETFGRDKFVTLFSLLFGISLYLVGLGDDDIPVMQRPLFRRLAWLVLFGLIHGALIWHGDILLAYAVTGFIMWRWRHEAAGRLLCIGGLLFVLGAAVLCSQGFLASPGELLPPHYAADDLATIAAMRGNFWSSLAGNAGTWAHSIAGNVIGYFPTTLGLMMVGLGLFKTGVLKAEAPARLYLRLMAAGAVSLVVIGGQNAVIIARHFPLSGMLGPYAIANTVLCLPVALGYASALILTGRSQFGKRLLHPLACTGRMAFSNYLTQSIVMTMIFYGGRGLGLYGAMNHAALWPIILAIWAVQLTLSTLWLTWFRYGPFEWLWRSLTYGRRLLLLRSCPTSGSGH